MHTPALHTAINPKKLLLSKWTAVHPQHKEKHFLVSLVIEPATPDSPIEWIELEAIISHRTQLIPWRELIDNERWLQGWH